MRIASFPAWPWIAAQDRIQQIQSVSRPKGGQKTMPAKKKVAKKATKKAAPKKKAQKK
ncbi:MAG: hypothetical protein JXO72_00925 [Vicinamibacteria bacterium]|nr:hypothetical protein [Vicinamibacteria bacterium]